MNARHLALILSILTMVCVLPANAQRQAGRCRDQLPANAQYREVLSVHMGNQNWPFIVLLPDGYSPDAAVRYPTIYLFHGNTDDECIGPERNHIERVTAAGAGYPPFIYVFVNGGPTCRYTDNHVNCPTQKSESYIMEELIPYIDANYKTVPNRSGRGLDGFSMGGEGVAKFGYKYSDQFCSFVAYSGHALPPEFEQNKAMSLANKLHTRFVVGGNEGDRITNVQSHHDAVKAAGIPTSFELVAGVGHSLPELYDGASGVAGIKTHFDCFAIAAAGLPPGNAGGAGGVAGGGAASGGAMAGGASAGGGNMAVGGLPSAAGTGGAATSEPPPVITDPAPPPTVVPAPGAVPTTMPPPSSNAESSGGCAIQARKSSAQNVGWASTWVCLLCLVCAFRRRPRLASRSY